MLREAFRVDPIIRVALLRSDNLKRELLWIIRDLDFSDRGERAVHERSEWRPGPVGPGFLYMYMVLLLPLPFGGADGG